MECGGTAGSIFWQAFIPKCSPRFFRPFRIVLHCQVSWTIFQITQNCRGNEGEWEKTIILGKTQPSRLILIRHLNEALELRIIWVTSCLLFFYNVIRKCSIQADYFLMIKYFSLVHVSYFENGFWGLFLLTAWS